MASKAGNLQVSVVEGKGLKLGQLGTTADPYVRLTLGTQEVQTDAVKGTLAPKWVKDFKLPVPITKPNLVVAISDEITKQDIGSTTIQIADIIAAGTTVHWYKIYDAAGSEAGEVCLVLRFIAPKDNVRSPSSSVTSLDMARSPVASVSSLPDGLTDIKTLANGNDTMTSASGHGPALTLSPSVKEAISKIEMNDPSGAEKLTQVATRDPPKEVFAKEVVTESPIVVQDVSPISEPRVTVSEPRVTTVTDPWVTETKPRVTTVTDPWVTTVTEPRVTNDPWVTTVSEPRVTTVTDPWVTTTGIEPRVTVTKPDPKTTVYEQVITEAPRTYKTELTNGAKEDVKPKPRKSKKKGGNPLGSLLGLAAALAAGAFVVANSKRKPKFYEVREGDTLCSIAGCFRLSVDELYDHNTEVTQDPDRIYPGDKFYIP